MPLIESLAAQAGSGIMGLALGGIQDRRQVHQQRRLQDLQIEGQTEMGRRNLENQIKLWKATNYDAQKAEMEKAGLNPALMYGMGGGGGSTAAAAAGSVTGGTAPQGGREAQDLMGMGLQMQLLKAQKENIEADTKKKNVEAEKTAGVDTEKTRTEIESLTQGITNQKAVETLTRVQTEVEQVKASVSRQTITEQMQIIENAAKQGEQEITQLQISNSLDAAQVKDKISLLKAQLITIGINNVLTKAQTANVNQDTKLKTEQTAKVNQDMWVDRKMVSKWFQENEINWMKLSQEERKVRTGELIRDMQLDMQGVGNITEIIEQMVDGVMRSKTGPTPIRGFGK